MSETSLTRAQRRLHAEAEDVPFPLIRTLRLGERLRHVPLALPLAWVTLLFFLACAIAPGLIAPYAATDFDYNAILGAPSLHHLFGTDAYGRDVASLVVYGARSSILMAGGAILLGTTAGGTLGLVSGYAGGRLDNVLMRFVDVWMSVPPMLLALILATALDGGFFATIIAVTSMIVPRFARIIRAQVISIKVRPFILAARTLGAKPGWILLRHVLPHTLPQLLVLSTLGMAEVVLIGASLSFIGLGVIDDRPDWGFLLSQGRDYMTVAWWYATFPGLAITALAISINLLGDALRQRVDARGKLE
jgi:peptide/nickel transport system permease protein